MIRKYLKKLSNFSIIEIPTIIIYTICHVVLNKLPKNIIKSHLLFSQLMEWDYKIEKYKKNSIIIFNVNGALYKFLLKTNSSDSDVFRQIILNDEYVFIIHMLHHYKISVKTMIDCGANVGYTTIYFKAFFPDASIISIEPQYEVFLRLNENVRINNLSNIITIQKGLWSTSTYLKSDFSFRDGQDWSHRLVPADENSIKKDLIKTITVNELMQEYEVEIIDFFKMDIEGAEAEVFSERADLSWLDKVKFIAIEIHDEFNCRKRIEDILILKHFSLLNSDELTIAINTKLISFHDSI